MKALTWIAWAIWLFSLGVVIWGLEEQNAGLLAAALSTAMVGVLFYAFGRVISLLTDIRNAVVTDGNDDLEPAEPDMSVENLTAQLERVRAGLPPAS